MSSFIDTICIDTIFVPQGPEFKAVQRGLNRTGAKVALCATTMGPYAIKGCLEQWLKTEFRGLSQTPYVLLMGLCGSVSPSLGVGDRVLYRSCVDAQASDSVAPLPCDAALVTTLQERLENAVTVVTSVTCDRMIHRASDKQALAERYGVDVVDMEGHAFLSALDSTGISAGMLRVVSDDALHDLPDLSAAMTEAGTLNPTKLALSMISQPRNALRLIQGSLSSLKQLENAAADLFMS
jgi:purine-nucleoside phosphorylase